MVRRRILSGIALAGSVLLATPVTAAHARPMTAVTAPQVAAADSWSEVRLPFLLPSAGVMDIAVQSADSIWIGGQQGYFCVQTPWNCLADLPGSPVVRQWNGSEWKEYPLIGSIDRSIKTVAAHGDEVWVLGASYGLMGYLGRFNGSAFLPVAKPTEHDVLSLWTGPAGTWALSSNGNFGHTLHRRTGDTWTKTPLPAGMLVHDLRALTATDAWVLGRTYDPAVPGYVSTLAHWDGTSWQTVTPPPRQGSEIVPVAADDIWVLSNPLQHWNGSEWQEVPGPDAWAFRGLAVGKDGVPWGVVDTGGRNDAYRYTGTGWERSEGMSVRADLKLAVVPGTNTIWASGNDGDAPGITSMPADPRVRVLRR